MVSLSSAPKSCSGVTCMHATSQRQPENHPTMRTSNRSMPFAHQPAPFTHTTCQLLRGLLHCTAAMNYSSSQEATMDGP